MHTTNPNLSTKLKRFGRNIPHEQSRVIRKAAGEIQRRAKLRATRFTGKLAKGIIVKPVGKNTVRITSTAPYGGLQEYGYRPHIVSTRHPKLYAWVIQKGIVDRNGNIPRKIMVRRFKPHMRPALYSVLGTINRDIQIGIEKAWMKR